MLKHTYAYLLQNYFRGREISGHDNKYENLISHDGLSLPTHEEFEEADKKACLLIYIHQREEAYIQENITYQKLIEALWSKVMENDCLDSDDIQLKRIAIKNKFPKPKTGV